MPIELWAKVAVGITRDPDLLRRKPWERWLFLSLICTAKELDADGWVDMDAETVAAVFRLGVPPAAVEECLSYFESRGMVLRGERGIFLTNYQRWQARVKDTPAAASERQRRKRARDKGASDTDEHRDVTAPVTATNTRDTSRDENVTSHAEAEAEAEAEKEEDLTLGEDPDNPGARSATPGPSLAALEADWPKALLERVRVALASTRSSGKMAETKWYAFLLRASQIAPEKRNAGAETYLDRGYAAERKPENYLLAMMRNGAGVEPPQPALALRVAPKPVQRADLPEPPPYVPPPKPVPKSPEQMARIRELAKQGLREGEKGGGS